MSTHGLLARISIAASACTVLLSGCATSYSPEPDLIGRTPEEVIARLGPPIPPPASLSGIRRLDFPRGPYGRHTYFVYFNEQGRAERYVQVLDEKNFSLIKPGMDRSEVLELIGVSRDTFLLARDRGYVWNYRYVAIDPSPCHWFQIEFTSEGKVRSTGYGRPPECQTRSLRFRR